MCPAKQQVIDQVLGSLPLMWKTQIELLAPSFGLVQTQLLWVFG